MSDKIDFSTCSDKELLGLIREFCQKIRKSFEVRPIPPDLKKHVSPRAFEVLRDHFRRMDQKSMREALDEARLRDLLPSLEDLEVAKDLAILLGHLDPTTGVPVEGPWGPGPTTLVDLWVDYRDRTEKP